MQIDPKFILFQQCRISKNSLAKAGLPMRERSSSDHHALNLKNIFVDGKHINFVMTFSLIKFNTNEVLIGPLSIGQLGCFV